VGKSFVRENPWREMPGNYRYFEKISFRQLKMLVQAFFIFNFIPSTDFPGFMQEAGRRW
jgi:hypothetical protein